MVTTPFRPKRFSPLTVTLLNNPSILVVNAGGEEEGVAVAAVLPVAERQPPEALRVGLLLEPAIQDQGLAVAAGELAEELAGVQVERIDFAVAEELPTRRALLNCPKLSGATAIPCGELRSPCEANRSMKLPLRVNSSMKPFVPHTRDIVVPAAVLLGVRDEQRAVDDS